MSRRWLHGFLWLFPLVVCLYLYRHTFSTWFQHDDFAWLGQRLEIHSTGDFFRLLFVPRAQGTIRPWSERLFFIAFSTWFGLDALPYRIWVMLTQCGSLILLQAIVRRITGSLLAGVAAPILWLFSIGLATPLTWASAYNQVLCGFFLLLAFWCLLRAIETGKRRWWIAQWVVFVLGFGALEIMVVYPALAASWAFLRARKWFPRTLWLFVVSAAYAVAHYRFAPKPTEGPYARHWDLDIIATYLRYAGNALAGGQVFNPKLPPWSWEVAGWVIGFVLLIYIAWAAWRRREYVPLFGLLWFTVVLAPILPLRDHFSEYYLAIPAVGVAMVLACLLRDSRVHVASAALALLLIGAHVAFTWPVTRTIVDWRWSRSQPIKALVFGLERAFQLHPGKLVLLSGVSSDLFWSAIYDKPYRIFGSNPVMLLPGEEKSIESHPELGDTAPFFAPPGLAAAALDRDKAVVYQVSDQSLQNITGSVRQNLAPRWGATLAPYVLPGLPLFEEFLGDGWHPSEQGFRWMGKRAIVRMAGPVAANSEVVLQGYCVPELLKSGPLNVSVTIDEQKVGVAQVPANQPDFDIRVPFTAIRIHKPVIALTLEVERTFRPAGDPRDLSLAFGQILLRPAQ